MTTRNAKRAAESGGVYTQLHGEYRMTAMTGDVTLAAAATSTAGHMFAMRNPSTTKKVAVRYVTAQFATTTAMTNQQFMGYDLIKATGYTASHTGGTAIDMFTATASQKVRANQDLTLFTVNTVRIGTTLGLTAGTHTLDGQPMRSQAFLSPVLGDVSPVVVLLDARDDGTSTYRSPLVLATDEGFIVRNVKLMGAVGVGNLIINVEWDEVTI